MAIAWGNKVTPAFRRKVVDICLKLGADPDHLMACMAFESGETFSPSIRNAAGSGAVGLIQFMPATAQALGTTTDKLAAMSAIKQLDYVELYFRSKAGKLKTLEDLYMAILWPAAAGKPLDYVLFVKGDPKYPKRYIQNAGLDFNKDGVITKAEAADKVRKKLAKGLFRRIAVKGRPERMKAGVSHDRSRIAETSYTLRGAPCPRRYLRTRRRDRPLADRSGRRPSH